MAATQYGGMMSQSTLLMDLYALTMAQEWWRRGEAERQSVFHLFLRRHPFGGDYTVFAGLAPFIKHCQSWGFSADDIAYLKTLSGPDGKPRFSAAFLALLASAKLTVDIHAVAEGQLVLAGTPVCRVTGPLWQCQLLEAALMNMVNISTLVATKAARIIQAVGEGVVSEFGLRRAQGPNGGVLASRAAYLGGVHSTSNLEAGRQYDIPVMGTLAHSWVMSFNDEISAFEAAARAMGAHTVLLVDTYDTLTGVQRAIDVCHRLRDEGVQLRAIRLDSGDLADLSRKARALLDAAGFASCQIIASGDLDEYRIADLRAQKAAIDVWGVGTRLVTAYDQPALELAYKLSGWQDAQGNWQWRAKSSNTPAKRSLPGILQVMRLQEQGRWQRDVIYSEHTPPEAEIKSGKPQLMRVLKAGLPAGSMPTLAESRQRATASVNQWQALSVKPTLSVAASVAVL